MQTQDENDRWTPDCSERDLMEAANATFLRDRPDLQYKFDASAPPLLPSTPMERLTAERDYLVKRTADLAIECIDLRQALLQAAYRLQTCSHIGNDRQRAMAHQWFLDARDALEAGDD